MSSGTRPEAATSSSRARRASATFLVVDGAHDEDARARERQPELERFRERRHAERGAARVEHGSRDVDGAVAVRVCLDHSPQLRRSGRALQPLRVAPDRLQVDREARSVHQPSRAAGSVVSRSPAMRPARCGTSSAARACAIAAAAAASCGSSPLARNEATIPVRTSPVPAVARAGGPRSQTIVPASGVATIVSAPFRRTTARNRARCFACRLQSMCCNPVGVALEEAPELARVRSEHKRVAPLDRLEGEEAVGVDDRGQRDALEKSAHEVGAPLTPSEPRAERESACPFGSVLDDLGRVVVSPTDLHGLEGERLGGRKRVLRNGQGHVARVGPQCCESREAGCAGHPARATDDENGSGAVLRVLRRPAGNEVEQRRERSSTLRRPGLEPDVADHDLAGMEPAGRDDVAHLQTMERDRHVRLDRCARNLSRRRIDPGREVHRDHGGRSGVDPRDEVSSVGSRLAVKAGAEEGIDDHVVAGDLVGLVRDEPGVAQHSRGDSPVAAVRASAAHARKPLRSRVRTHRLACHGAPGSLHELGDRLWVAGIPLLRGAHLGCGVERIEHVSPTRAAARRRRPQRSPGNGSSRGRSHRR